MKVNSAADYFTRLNQGSRREDLKGHRYGRSIRTPRRTGDAVEISEEARARFLNGRSVIEKRAGRDGYAHGRIEVNEIADLTGGDFIDPARLERVLMLKELVASGRYDFDDPGALQSASEAVISALLG